MKRLVIAVCLLLCASQCWAQQLEITIDKRIRLDASGNADVWMWNLPPTVIYAQAGGTVWIDEDTPPGTYRANVVALIIDWEKQSLEQRQGFVDFTVGGRVDPEGIPDDRFRNIGQNVHDWAKELRLNKTSLAAQNYSEVGMRLLSGDIATIDASAEELSKMNAADDLTPKDGWTEWGVRVNRRWQAFVIDEEDAGEFYKAVAAGLEAVR